MIVESYEDVIILSGALRSNFWDTIHTAISLLLKRHPSGVIIDCAAISECTIEGADTFIDILEFIESHEARVIVARVPDHVVEVLRLVPGVRSQLPIAASVEEARKSLDVLDQPRESVRKRKQPIESRIVMLLNGDASDVAGARAAVNLAEIMRGEVITAFVIVVPRHLPEQAPLPDKEAAAIAAFDAVRSIFDEHNVPMTPALLRGRDVGSALDELMREKEAHTLVVPISTDLGEIDEELKLARSVMTKVEQSILLVRPPLT